MRLTGVHILTTYQCTLQCSHCFVWGSPWQTGTMSLPKIRMVLEQAAALGSVETICFEGGEPFLYYGTLLRSVSEAKGMGFRTGIVTNGYWATSDEDALTWLSPMAGVLDDLTISSDLYHWDDAVSKQAESARVAAERLGIPVGGISVAQPEAGGSRSVGTLPPGESAVMYRGRAAEQLAVRADEHFWEDFDRCGREELRDPKRVHVDPFGNIHLCQGLSAGNLFLTPLADICRDYDPARHPIVGPLLAGGPAALVMEYGLKTDDGYADSCHLCDHARRQLRDRFPRFLGPDQMYGVC